MVDLFDEVMDVLNDAETTRAESLCRPKTVDIIPVSTTNLTISNYLGGEPRKLRLQQEWPKMIEFDHDVMRESVPGDGELWNINSFAAHSQKKNFLSPGLPVPLIPASSHSSQLHAACQNGQQSTSNKRPWPQIAQGRKQVGILDLSQFEYNPRTPERASQCTSSSPQRSSPIPYNPKRPYIPPAKNRQIGILRTEPQGPKHPFPPGRDPRTCKDLQRSISNSGELTCSHTPPVVHGIPLISVDILPNRFRGIFAFPLFNAVQSRCFHSVYESNDNIVLSSPTGSGKTAVMELAICALANELNQGNYKVIYQAPTKALCAERKRDWGRKFSALGLVCTELTGDTQQAQLKNVKNGDIIITTPEKWDSMTRRWDDHKKLLELVRLFLIDEVHILKEARGATLEVIVSRMKSTGSNVRFLALSATVPNSVDIAFWLARNSYTPNLPALEARFGEEFRPVKLQKFVYGYQSTGNDFMFDKTLDKMLPELIRKHSSGKPMMIFCMTRAICLSTAKMLAEQWKSLQEKQKYWPSPTMNFSFKDKDLQARATRGVAFHHAGLDASDRALVERLFLEGCLHIICCTSTLAVGINLPAYLVIIKNTATWADGQTKEYVDLEVMQMLGRAGRPQFDDSAVAVIMTKKENKLRYEKMFSGTETLESCLHTNLVEHMNAEVGLGTITNVESAKLWLRSTFLYVCLKRNPAHYKLDQYSGIKDVDQNLEEICEKNINLLRQTGLILSNESQLKCSELGNAMARYYIKFATMQTIIALPEKTNISDVLLALSQAEEFKDIRFRGGERGLYKELNRFVKYPIKVEFSNASQKAFILFQVEMGMIEFPVEANLQKYKTTLNQDKNLVFQHCHRVIRCIIDCKLHFKDSTSVLSALEVARCLKARAWENSPLQLRQIEGLGPASIKKLINAGVRSLEMLEQLEPHKIETIMSRNPPFGSKVARTVGDIPKLRVFSSQVSKICQSGNRKDPVKLDVQTEVGYLNDRVPGKFRGMTLFANFLAERSDGLLIEFRRIPVFKLEGGKEIRFTVDLEAPDQSIICYLVCEDIVGTMRTHELKPDIELTLYPPQPPLPLPDFSDMKKTPHFTTAQGFRESVLVKRVAEVVNQEPVPLNTEESGGSKSTDGNQYFLHIDDFDNSDLDDIVVQQTRKGPHMGNRLPTSNGQDMLLGDVTENAEEVEQLSNGNWNCRHKCGDKTKCKHLCCREGLEKPPKPIKRKISMKKQPLPAKTRPTQANIATSKQALNPRSKGVPGSFRPLINIRPRESAVGTHMKNGDTEILDLVGDGGGCHLLNTIHNLEKLKTLHSQSNITSISTLDKRPIYPYSSKVLSKLSFDDFAKVPLSDNGEQLTPEKYFQRSLLKNSLPLDTSPDYDEMGIDSFVSDIAFGLPIVENVQGLHVSDLSSPLIVSTTAVPSTPLGLREGSVEYKWRKSLQTKSPRFLATSSHVLVWQAPKLSSFGHSCQASSGGPNDVGFGEIPGAGSLAQNSHSEIAHEYKSTMVRGLASSNPRSIAVKSTSFGGSGLHRKRIKPFSAQPIEQTQGILHIGINEETLFRCTDAHIKDTEEETRFLDQDNMNLTFTTKPTEIPANILDFLGDCVVYLGQDVAEGSRGKKQKTLPRGDKENTLLEE